MSGLELCTQAEGPWTMQPANVRSSQGTEGAESSKIYLVAMDSAYKCTSKYASYHVECVQ